MLYSLLNASVQMYLFSHNYSHFIDTFYVLFFKIDAFMNIPFIVMFIYVIFISHVTILVWLICCDLLNLWVGVEFKIEIESLGIDEIQLDREKYTEVREETCFEVKCHCLLFGDYFLSS